MIVHNGKIYAMLIIFYPKHHVFYGHSELINKRIWE